MPKITERQRVDLILGNNSLERVINTAMRLAESIASRQRITPELREDADTNLQDWKELKSIASALWNEARDRAFRRGNPDLPRPGVEYDGGVPIEMRDPFEEARVPEDKRTPLDVIKPFKG
jgi:hypothetical protein